ncbi:MAG: molybdopterin-dependent oxidoreductase [Wenzhouxiangella sp.]|jgi:thiosulfate reductase/polysulfide reductase chain A|nr:molybdopterin-dependent oxidoreductase [Wenzhouxiangella sp.]
MKRREFIQLSATAGVASMAPLTLTGCKARPLPGQGEVVETPTLCNVCFWRCAGKVSKENGQPWKIEGNPDDLHSNGRFCVRGDAGIGMYKDPDRLKQPMLRVTENGQQRFKPVSWEEALDYVAEKMNKIKEEHGEDRLCMFSHGAGGSLFRRTLRAFGSAAYTAPSFAQCRGPREVAFALTYGEGVGSPDRTDMENSRCIVLIGSHLGENLHNGQVQTWIEALRKGATVITVDPRFSVAAGKSKHWLPIKPGTDIALMLAWMNVLINENLYDADYIARYASGFDQLRQHVQPYTPEWAYGITGIRPDVIRTTAREMAMAAPATLVHPGRHVTWYGDDTQRSRAIAILTALLGAWGRPGGYYYQENVELPRFPLPTPPQPKSNYLEEVQSEFPLAPQGIAQKFIDASVGEDAYFKGWIVYSSNLGHTIPGVTEKLAQASQDLDLLVVVDTMPYGITGYADVILPECTYLERLDPIRNMAEREPSLAVSVPAFEPKYDSKPGWWISKQIAERLGLGDWFPWEDFSEELDWQLRQIGSSFEEMAKVGVKKFPRTTPKYFAPGENRTFRTGTGKIELYSQMLADFGHDPMPKYTPPPEKPDGNYLHLNYGRAPAHTFGRTINNPLLFELMPENTVWIHPVAASTFEVENGQYVRLKNQDGVESNAVRVRVTERIRPDSLFMAHGFGHNSADLSLANGRGADDQGLITRILVDPIMGGTGMRGNFVTLIPEEASA